MRWLGGAAATGAVWMCLVLAACSSQRARGTAAGDELAGGQAGQSGHGSSGSGGAAAGDGGVGGAPGAGGAGGDAPEGGAGASGSGGEDAGGGWAGGPQGSLALDYDWVFPRKVQRAEAGWLVLLERTQLLSEYWAPARELRWLDAAGTAVQAHGSTAESAVLDFARHPSGQVTVLVSTNERYWLRRFDAQGAFLGEAPVQDALIDRDPPALPPGIVTPPIEQGSRDAGRIAALGESSVVATRTGRHSVVVYGFGFDAGSFEQAWRTLVVPGHSLYPVGLTGGSYDTFGQLDSQFVPHVAVSEGGVVFVATQHALVGGDDYIDAHFEVFGEHLVGDPDHTDLYVTRLSSAGARLGTSVVGTARVDELYGLRAAGETAYLTGRTDYWNDQGTSFDALIGMVAASDGSVQLRELDVDRSDLAFDVYPLGGGRLLVAGVSGYVQNPHGASVSEPSRAFLTELGPAGVVQAVTLPQSLRHDEARALLLLDDAQLLVGGMLDGPGTHSADSDATRIRANGFLRQLVRSEP